MKESTSDLPDVIDGKYRLLSELGRGGMGVVYEARHEVLGTTVALKFLHPHLARDAASMTRFVREARAAATITSVHAARIMDVDQLPSGELYIVMEHLVGYSLDAIARDGCGLPVAEAVDYVVQACGALAEAHERGVIHRDIKPANLFLTRGRNGHTVIKVLDFGLAKSGQPDLLVNGKVKAFGTPRYMSPEQIGAAADIDGRSDVWSIGATLYELLTGRPAFQGQGAVAIFGRVLTGNFVPVRVVRPDVPPAVAAIIERCLEVVRDERFDGVRELAIALRAALARPSTRRVQTLLSPCDRVFPAAPRATLSDVTMSSLAPAMTSLAPDAGARSGAPSPTVAPPAARRVRSALSRTLLAVLAGPLLIASTAAGMALTLVGAPAYAAAGASSLAAHGHSARLPRAEAHVTATSADTITRRRDVDGPREGTARAHRCRPGTLRSCAPGGA